MCAFVSIRLPTVRCDLKVLAARLACETTNSRFFVYLDAHGAVMVAKDAFECRRQRVALYVTQ